MNVNKIVFWVFVLIGAYLVLSRGREANQILTTLSRTSLQGVAVLQGRNVAGVTG